MRAIFAAHKSVLVAFLSSLLFVFGYTSAMPAASVSYSQDSGGIYQNDQNNNPSQANDSSGDCSNDYVIHCGVTSASDIQNHLDENCVANIFAASPFNISRSDVISMDETTAPLGDVYTNGDIKVQTTMPNGRTGYHLVATNAMTAGFTNIAGSTEHMCGNTAWFERPPSVSFRSSPLPAFVMLDSSGQFKFAILKRCGNPVTGTPVTPPVTQPPKQTPPPAQTQPQTQSQTQSQNQTQTQSQSQSQTVTVNQPEQQMPQTPTSNTYNYTYTQPAQQTTYTPPKPQRQTPTYTAPASNAPSYSLPNTGPGNVIGLASLFGTVVGGGHYVIFGRRRGSLTFLSGVKYF